MSAVFFRLVCARRRDGVCGPSIHCDRAVVGVRGRRCAVQAEEFGQNAIATVSQLDGFQPGKQTTLLLVKQAVEKQDGRFEFIGRYLKSGGDGQQRNRLGGLPGAELIASMPAIGGGVKETPGHLGAAQTFGAHEIVEGILDLSMDNVGQFIGEPAVRGLVDEGLDGGDERAITRKPNRIVGPQADVVEAGGFAEGIVTTAMGIAGEVIQELELSKDGEVGAGAESSFEFGQSGDFVAQEMLAESLGIEGEWAHNVIVPTGRVFQSEL
jgi:hypothetical protein